MDIIGNAFRNMEGSDVIVKSLKELDIEKAAFKIIKYPMIGIENILNKKAYDLTNEEIRKLKDYKRQSIVISRLEELEYESYEESKKKHYNAMGIEEYKTEFLYPVNLLTLVTDRLEDDDLDKFYILVRELNQKINDFNKPEFIDIKKYNFSNTAEKIISPYVDYECYIGCSRIPEWDKKAMYESVKSHFEANERYRKASEIAGSKIFVR